MSIPHSPTQNRSQPCPLNESRWLGTQDILSTRKNAPTGIISIMAHAFRINLLHTTELSEQFKGFALSSQYYIRIFFLKKTHT